MHQHGRKSEFDILLLVVLTLDKELSGKGSIAVRRFYAVLGASPAEFATRVDFE